MRYINGRKTPTKGFGRYNKLTQVKCAVCGKEFTTAAGSKITICEECLNEGKTVSKKRKSGYPCNTRRICKSCRHRELIDSSNYICACLLHTGEIRDLTADDEHCATFSPKGGKK